MTHKSRQPPPDLACDHWRQLLLAIHQSSEKSEENATEHCIFVSIATQLSRLFLKHKTIKDRQLY